MKIRAAAAPLLACLAACSASPTPSTSTVDVTIPGVSGVTGVTGVSSNTDVEHYFPLLDGYVYSFATDNEDGVRGVLNSHVHRTDATHGELVYTNGRKRFIYSPEGVRADPSGAFVLAAPIAVGTTFRGQNGGQARIEDTHVVISVRAGNYRECVRVVEERGGDRRARFTTTFCPGVGVVALEAVAGTSYERAELVSYGPPVKLPTDGTTVTHGDPAP